MTSQLDALVPAELSPLSLARMLWKRRLIALSLWLALSAATIILVRRLPSVYSAEAVILVDSQKVPEKYVATTVSTDAQGRMATITQQLMSSRQLTKIIEDFNLYGHQKGAAVRESTLERLRSDIVVNTEKAAVHKMPGAFRIGYQGQDPVVVAQVANRVANLFIEENLKVREGQAEGTSEFIEAQLQEAKRRLEELEATVSSYKQSHNGELPQQETSILGTLGRLQAALDATRDGLGRSQLSLVTLESSLAAAEASQELESSQPLAAAVSPQRQGNDPQPIAAAPPVRPSVLLQAELDQLRERYNDEHPDVRRLRSKLERQRLAEEAQSQQPAPQTVSTTQTPASSPAITAPAVPAAYVQARKLDVARAGQKVSTLRAQIDLTQKDIEKRKVEQQHILDQIAVAQSRVDRLPLREQEMARVTRDYEIQKGNYLSLLDKKLAAEMATALERRQKSERFTLIDPARTPEHPTRPNRLMYNLIGCISGLVLGIVTALALEFRKGCLLGEWELPRHTVVLGRLPHIDGESASSGFWNRFRFLRGRQAASVSALLVVAIGVLFWSRS